MFFLLVIVDADPSGNTCHNALFNIGGSTTTSRSWTILVTQYGCGDTDKSGYVKPQNGSKSFLKSTI